MTRTAAATRAVVLLAGERQEGGAMIDQSEWIKVVTDPLGIAAFALFVVFVAMTKMVKPVDRKRVTNVLLIMAAIVLVGGLVLSYLNIKRSVGDTGGEAAATLAPANVTVHGQTSGNNSPVIGVVEGDADLTVGDDDKTE
jgi:small neutral amino acid transporter SnatA (MarC family)